MNNKLAKPVIAIAVCAAAIAGMLALPGLLTDLSDARLFSGRRSLEAPARSDALSSEGASRPAALALYIERSYLSAGYGEPVYLDDAGAFEELKQAGVIPRECVPSNSAEYWFNRVENGCQVVIEPVSGLVTSVMWAGSERDGSTVYYYYKPDNKMNAEQLMKNYADYLGLGDVEDWRSISFKSDYQDETTLGRWSPSCQVYISTSADSDGNASGVSASSHTAAEMEPLLALCADGGSAIGIVN